MLACAVVGYLRILRHGLERIIVELVLSIAFCAGIGILLQSFWSAHAITPIASTGSVSFRDEKTVITTPNQRKASEHAQPTMRPE